jgi:hypothetical protein
MSRTVDPAIARFVEQINAGANAAADSVAGLILRLVTRVGALEKTVTAQASKLETLSKQPKPRGSPVRARTHDAAPVTRIETGVDAFGNPVRHEIQVRRSRGRPKGSRDSYQRPPRAPHNLVEAELSSTYIDPDWDRWPADQHLVGGRRHPL